MPISKNAYLRYLVLDRCFQNFQKKYFHEDLLQKVNNALFENNSSENGIARTQLFNDIKFMKSEAGFSIELGDYREGKKKYYRYVDKDFSIKNSPINFQEIEHIKSAIAVLSRFKGLPQFEWVNEIIPMLSDKFGTENLEKEIIFFDTNVDYSGIHLIEPIFNAIKNKKVLKIEYQEFNSEQSREIIFHPYILKQYNNRWFTFGLNQKLNFPTWNLPLDRIKNSVECNLKYIHTKIDWEDDFFYDIIGVSRIEKNKLNTVTLQFHKDLAPYIQTKPIHPSQSKPKFTESGQMIISIKVIPNYELERLLLSFGERVKILSPKKLQQKIKKRIFAINALYDD